MDFEQYQIEDKKMAGALSKDTDQLNAIAKQAIADGYDGLDITILHESAQVNFNFPFPIFHEDDPDYLTSQSLLLIERHADAMLRKRNLDAIRQAVSVSELQTNHQ